MGDVVNLRAARKAVVRNVAAQKAAENAVKFGRSKADKSLQLAQKTKAKRDLDAKKLE